MPEITIKDIAKRCGVGVSTVSRAMNNHPDINQETKNMVMEVIREVGFVPNNSARNLKRTDAKCIAVLVKGISNPLFGDMIQVIEEETQKKKYSLVLMHVEYDEDEVDVALELVKEKRLRGIIFLGGYFFHSQEKISNLTVPYIFSTIGAATPENMNRALYSSVSVDDRKESYAMTSYLLGLGHRDIAILSAETEINSIGQLRLEGYKKALAEKGIPFRENLVRCVKEDIVHYSMDNGYLTTKELIASGERFTAVYATADILAVGACSALIEAGLRIPEDVSVTGYDGIDVGKYYNPAITTIKQPVKEIAETTIHLLFDIIAGRKKCEHIVLPAELVVRASSGPAKQ
ncbi:MAG: LacI family transcriptional regulator [Lachnospiraceae bacterium]|jgi:LacI family transcriptional regulator|nr:LacI family transcriptional regulator [Lachnospiraceae bacterium]